MIFRKAFERYFGKLILRTPMKYFSKINLILDKMGEEVEKLSDLEGKISDLTRSVQDIQVRQVQGVPQNMTTARRPNS